MCAIAVIIFVRLQYLNENVLYAFRKEEDEVVRVTVITNAHEAKQYFDEIFLSDIGNEMEVADGI